MTSASSRWSSRSSPAGGGGGVGGRAQRAQQHGRAPRRRRRGTAARAGSRSCRRPRSGSGTGARGPPAAPPAHGRRSIHRAASSSSPSATTARTTREQRMAVDDAQLRRVPDVGEQQHRAEHQRAQHPARRARARPGASSAAAAHSATTTTPIFGSGPDSVARVSTARRVRCGAPKRPSATVRSPRATLGAHACPHARHRPVRRGRARTVGLRFHQQPAGRFEWRPDLAGALPKGRGVIDDPRHKSRACLLATSSGSSPGAGTTNSSARAPTRRRSSSCPRRARPSTRRSPDSRRAPR